MAAIMTHCSMALYTWGVGVWLSPLHVGRGGLAEPSTRGVWGFGAWQSPAGQQQRRSAATDRQVGGRARKAVEG